MSDFAQFNLPVSILKNLDALNFKVPTPIQVQAIPPGLEGRDVRGMAQTGTGKTAAFAIPLLVRLMEQPHQNALVLAPTRELAMQIHAFFKDVAGKNFNLTPTLVIGGNSMNQQARELRNGARVIIATPGRLVDHMNRNPKLLQRSSMVVFDEADRMLDMGFMPQIRMVIKGLPRDRQTMMFSATFPPEIKKLAAEMLRNPAEISVGEPSKPIEKIDQAVIHTTQKEKNEILLDELNAREGAVLIFTRTKHRTDRLAKFLHSYGHKVTLIHGNRSQGQRKQAIEGFRRGQYRILVATDIASRGLDIDGIEHVINYDLPQVPEDYIHRIGRTARNGKSGQALALLTPDDRQMWQQIQRVAASKSGGALPPIGGASKPQVSGADGGVPKSEFAGSREEALEKRSSGHRHAGQQRPGQRLSGQRPSGPRHAGQRPSSGPRHAGVRPPGSRHEGARPARSHAGPRSDVPAREGQAVPGLGVDGQAANGQRPSGDRPSNPRHSGDRPQFGSSRRPGGGGRGKFKSGGRSGGPGRAHYNSEK